MMNSDAVADLSQHFAKRLLLGDSGAEERVALGYRIAISRDPTSEEVARAVAFVVDAETMLQQVDKMDVAESQLTAWAGFCQSLLASSEFRYLN